MAKWYMGRYVVWMIGGWIGWLDGKRMASFFGQIDRMVSRWTGYLDVRWMVRLARW